MRKLVLALLTLAAVPASAGAPQRGFALLDDPTDALRLGPHAVSRGQIDILRLAGVSYGEGQSIVTRQANARLLQAAFTAADRDGLELACPAAATIEIDNTTGLLAAQTGNPGFRARFHQKCNIVQFGMNTPILTIGDPTGANIRYEVDWEGGEFNYGAPQTGDRRSICVLFGPLNYSLIQGILACDLPGTTGGAKNPPWVGMQVGDADYAGTGQWFSDTLRRVNIGGGQHALFAVYVGGTGSVWEDIYMHNGNGVADAQPVSGDAAFIDDPGNGRQTRSDDVWTRINVEHFQGAAAMFVEGVYNTTFLGLHCEDPQLDAYGPAVFALANAQVDFISPFLLDFHTIRGAGGPRYVFKLSYGARVQVENMKLKWSSVAHQLDTPGVFFFSGDRGRSDADDDIAFEAANLSVQDDSAGLANAADLELEPAIPVPLSVLQHLGRYVYDPVTPVTERAEFTVPGPEFTLTRQHEHALIIAPAALAAAQTITLANTREAGSMRFHRLGGHYANPTTIRDGLGKVLASIGAAGADAVFASDGHDWGKVPGR